MWRWSIVLLAAPSLTGCFGLLAPEPGVDGGVHEAGAPEGGARLDAGAPDTGPISEDAGLIEKSDGQVLAPDGEALAPVPTCTGSTSDCILTSKGWVGAAEVTCTGIYFVGYVTLTLELQINGIFQVIDHQTLDRPGLGAQFSETSVPSNVGTYRVCVVDSVSTRCGAPFTTEAPPDCACEPITCEYFQSCNATVDDGCGGTTTCGPCTNGNTCSPETRSCCGPGLQPDGAGICVCAPTTPCKGGQYWNVDDCACDFPNVRIIAEGKASITLPRAPAR